MLRLITLALLATLLAACTPFSVRTAWLPEERAKIKEVNAEVIVVQDEILVDVTASNYGAGMQNNGGLIAIALNNIETNSRVQQSQKAMGSFYQAIEDVDFRSDFGVRAQQELNNYPIKVVSVETTPKQMALAQIQQRINLLGPDQALLIVVPRYSLTMDYRALNARASVSLWTKYGGQAPVHRGVVVYQSKPVGPGGPPSADLWAQDHGALFRSALDESEREIAKLVVLETDVAPLLPPADAKLQTYPFVGALKVTAIKGQLIKETPERVIIMDDLGEIVSIPRDSTH